MARVSTSIANEVRRIRQERGMSAQKLADRCAELGAPIPRTVLSNLENGRRGNVTVAEMLVLAAALDVPPATLVFPVGYQAAVEALPGQTQPPVSAIEWLVGLQETGDAETKKSVPLYRFRGHERQVVALTALLAQVTWDTGKRARQELEELAVRRTLAASELNSLRERAMQLSAKLAEMDSATAEADSADQHAIHEALYRAEARLAETAEREKMAQVRASLAENHRRQALSQIEDLREDREDMERRGWILPDLPGRVAKALESGLPSLEESEG